MVNDETLIMRNGFSFDVSVISQNKNQMDQMRRQMAENIKNLEQENLNFERKIKEQQSLMVS